MANIHNDNILAHAINEDTDQIARMRSLIWVFAGRTRLTVGFVGRWFKYQYIFWL